MFELLFQRTNKIYEKIFYNYGKFLVKHHLYIIFISFTINIILSFGLLNIKIIKNSDELFLLQKGNAGNNEIDVKNLFKSRNLSENFYLYQLADLGTGAEVNFYVNTSSMNMDDNILKKVYFDEISRIHEYIVSKIKVTDGNGEMLTYEKICAKRFGKCWVEGYDILNDEFFAYLDQASRESTASILNKNLYIGKHGITDLSFTLGRNFTLIQNYTYARTLKLRYSLKSDYDAITNIDREWESEFIRQISGLRSNFVILKYAVSQSIVNEIDANIRFDMFLITATFSLIVIFAILLMSINTNLITSPGIILPLAGIFSALFAVSSAFGLLAFCGIDGCNLIYIIPFLVMGIGIDDMFIIYASFVNQNKHQDTTKRIANTFRKAGVSITITSITDFIAFIVGIISGFKGVRIFCLYAAFTIIFCYLYQLTFFAGWLVVHSNRINQKRNTLLWCIKYETPTRLPSRNGTFNEIFKTTDNPLTVLTTDETETTSSLNSTHNEFAYKSTGQKINRNSRKQFLSSIFRAMFGHIGVFYKYILTQKIGKCITIIIFVIYLTFSSWQATKIREGVDLGDLVADNSYFRAFIQDNLQQYDMRPFVMLVINKPLDYTNKDNRRKIRRFLDKCQNIPGINQDFLFNWMEHFEEQLRHLRKHKNSSILLEIENDKSPYTNDVVIKLNKTNGEYEIVASRFYIRYSELHFSSIDAIPMHALKDACDSSELPIYPYAVTFKYYEQFEQILPNVLQAFVIAAEAMYLISFIFMPDLVTTILIVCSMISIMLGLVGFMHTWGLTLSAITMIELVMSVGFCIDFSAHLAHAFIASVGKGTRSERAYLACIKVGLPIFNSAISSIIGVFVLSFSQSYIFKSFFKTMFLVMSLGLLNSMLFLPVFLSIVGPHWKRHVKTPIKRIFTL